MGCLCSGGESACVTQEPLSVICLCQLFRPSRHVQLSDAKESLCSMAREIKLCRP